MGITISQAEVIARAFLSQEVQVVNCKDLPRSPYGFDADKEYLFAVADPHILTVGGTRHIAVSKTTGQVKDCGLLGE